MEETVQVGSGGALQGLMGRDAGTLPVLVGRTERPPLVLAGIAHDARNLVTALGLCAEMVSEPGVLAPEHGHFAAEIRSLAEASGRLVQRLAAMTHTETAPTFEEPAEAPIEDLAESVRQLGNLLSAIAGPVVELQIASLPCRGRLRLSEESLTRILVNLVRNAADAMPTGGRIRITTQRGGGRSFLWTVDHEELLSEEEAAQVWGELDADGCEGATEVVLTVEDDGPGIPAEFRERVFDAGFTTRQAGRAWPETQHHGLGLNIVRTLVENAGGCVRAGAAPIHGTRLEIELPITCVTGALPSECPDGGRIDR
ncbi:MAG: HAMP domain-containing sensor histidine kinase [Acidobacteriaceae bacterium]